jgi:predicted dehydrogenase
MHRRYFLKTLAATTATAAATSAFPQIVRAETLGRNTAASPGNRLAIALIGCGGQGRGDMGAFLASKRAQVVALCDPDDEMRDKALARVRETYGETAAPFTTRDYREIISRPDIDAVLIATPDHWHCLAATAAARAGKHIYCEKPAASSIPEGRAMVGAITRAGVTCQIGSQQRSTSEFQRAIDLARGGWLGKITSVKVGLPRDTQMRPKNPPPPRPEQIPDTFDYNHWLGPCEALPYFKDRVHFQWRWSFAFAGGQVSDWIGHHYDIAALALNVARQQPVAIRNARATFINDSPLYNTARDYSFEAHYANGAVIDVSSAHRDGLTITGSEGWVYVARGKIDCSSETLRRLVIPAQSRIFANGPKNHMDQFIDAALTGSAPRCPVNEAHNIAAAAHLANAAFRSGRSELRWNPDTETPIDAPDTAPFLRRTYRAPWVLLA